MVETGGHGLAVAIGGEPPCQQRGVDLGVELQRQRAAQRERL